MIGQIGQFTPTFETLNFGFLLAFSFCTWGRMENVSSFKPMERLSTTSYTKFSCRLLVKVALISFRSYRLEFDQISFERCNLK